MAHRAADKAAQHIARPHIRRQYPLGIADNKNGRAGMIADNADRRVVGFVVAVFFAGKFFDRMNDGLKHFRIVHGFFALQHSNRTLDSHTGIDAAAAQFVVFSVFVFIVFHKDIVPYFDIFAA